MEPMKKKWVSSRVDLGYTELFCIPDVTAVFLSSCDSFIGDSLVFHQAYLGYLRVSLGTRNCSAPNAGDSGLNFRRGRYLMGFLLVQQEPGYILELQRGCPFETTVGSAKSGFLSS